ncbi:MAG: protease SohB, partial [Natronospirillum sp.]
MWTDYLQFLLRTVTIVVAVGIVIALIAAASRSSGQGKKGRVKTEDLSRQFDRVQDQLQAAITPEKKTLKRWRKARKQALKLSRKANGEKPPKHAYVLDFKGDVQASQATALSASVSAVLAVAQAGETVVVRLESPGGVVHGYGLAASQLARLKAHGLTVWVTVDKVAASGGYMMAALADRIYAAPFAVVGSIGVVAQLPNLHRFLKKHDIDVELHTAGDFKRTLT